MTRDSIPIVSAPKEYLNRQNNIGSGRYGSVYKIIHPELDQDQTLYAAKHCSFDIPDGETTFERELKVLSSCKCEFIIRLHGIYEFINDFGGGKGLILEYSQRSLGSFLHDKPINIENEKYYHLGHVVRWMRCAAEGLRYLHTSEPPIIHRDIKPDNCLLFDDGLCLKLADFGVTRHGHINMTNMAGSIIWMAPEVANSTQYTAAVDTYSWALMFWECLTRKIPYFNCRYMSDAEEKSHLTQYMVLNKKQNEPPLPIEGLPFPFGPLLDECWSVDPEKRLPMTEIVKIMIQLELCAPEPTRIDLEKNETPYAASVSTIMKSQQTVKRALSQENALDQLRPAEPTPSRRTHSRSRSAGPKDFDYVLADRMAKSSEGLDETGRHIGLRNAAPETPRLRREMSAYSDNVFRNERPKSDHYVLDTHDEFTGCATPIQALFNKYVWGDGTKSAKISCGSEMAPLPDPVCSKSKDLYDQARNLLQRRENIILDLQKEDEELARMEDAKRREAQRCQLLEEYLSNKRLKREHMTSLSSINGDPTLKGSWAP